MYGYDKAGNRISLSEGAFSLGTVTVTSTTNYGYSNASWGDQLTSAGENYFSYDDIGNMVVRYIDGIHATLTWDGRRLESYEDGSGIYYAYKYDSDGRRISKTSDRGGTISTVYEYNGDKLVCERFNGSIRYYIYDENGSIAGMRYRTSSYAEGVFDEYFFEKNLQGDVVAVYNASGTKLISYKYDAWGNFTTTYHNGGASTTAVNNPFRYRGYYYDSDTGLYYLNSRYYDPVTGRFISADIFVSTGQGIIGHNMYAYCNNNPIMCTDPCGTCLHRWDFWKDCSRCAGKNFGEKAAVLGEDIVNAGKAINYEIFMLGNALEFDVGLGVGLGGSVEGGGLEATGLLRADILTLRKNAGEDMFLAQADECYAEIAGAGTSFPIGYKAINYFSGERYEEPIYPDWETTKTYGASAYLLFGVTLKIGFDFDYYLESRFNISLH